MPVHDWTRVNDGIFHIFHEIWIGELFKAFNSDLLSPDCYALAEEIPGSWTPTILALRKPSGSENAPPREGQGVMAAGAVPPKVRLKVQTEMDEYTLKQRTLVIRHSSNHRIVALIEILSPGNKSNRHAFRALLDKAAGALAHKIHLLLIDLHPPGSRDPQGIHGAIWEMLTGDAHEQPTDKPLTLVAYVAGPVKTAYVEPIAVGDPLPDMPIFLNVEEYINVPLEPTYQAAYTGVPRFYREILER